MARLDYWFEFGSTYSYLATMRIGGLARERGIEVIWQPFLLGPIFSAQGWNTSPFNIYPAKGEYMWTDMARQAERLGLPFRRLPAVGPGAFPQNGLLASRMALIGFDEGWGEAFAREVFTAEFGLGRDIADPELLLDLARSSGGAGNVMARAQTEANKVRLRAKINRAIALGIFGAPSFVVDGALYWGNDRLDDALAAAAGETH